MFLLRDSDASWIKAMNLDDALKILGPQITAMHDNKRVKDKEEAEKDHILENSALEQHVEAV